MALIEKPEATIEREKAAARIVVREPAKRWNSPIVAQGEEVPFLESTVLGPRMEAGIRWAVTEDHDWDRIRALHACPQCLTPFPAPPSLQHIAAWRALTSEQWNWGSVELREAGLANIALGCCPVCAFEVSAEMLGVQDLGPPVRDTDPEWKEHLDAFDERAEDYFKKTERQRDGRSTGFKPRGGFLSHRPIRDRLTP